MEFFFLAAVTVLTVFLFIKAKKVNGNKHDYKLFLINNFLTLTLSFLGIFGALYLNDYNRKKVEKREVCSLLETGCKDISYNIDVLREFVINLHPEMKVSESNKYKPDKLLAVNSYIAGYYSVTPLSHPENAFKVFNEASFLKWMSDDFVMTMYAHYTNYKTLLKYIELFSDPIAKQVNDSIEYDTSDVCLLDQLMNYTMDLTIFAYYCEAELKLLKGEISSKEHAKTIQKIEQENRPRMMKPTFVTIRVPRPSE